MALYRVGAIVLVAGSVYIAGRIYKWWKESRAQNQQNPRQSSTKNFQNGSIPNIRCSLCLRSLEFSSVSLHFPCAHFMHAECGRDFLINGGGRNCPECYVDVSDEFIERIRGMLFN